MKVGAILPTAHPARVLAAVLKNVEEYKVININQTEAQFFWRYGLEVLLIIKEGDLTEVEDKVLLNNDWKLNIMLNGRKPECRICKKTRLH